jgi:hypothetical protein
MKNEEVKLMFLASQSFDSGKAVRGAFLLTDGATKPLEFRCTSPVRPSNLQVVLYGKVLEHHMIVELIGKPLIEQVREKPDIIIVKEKTFLELRPQIDLPLVQLTKEEGIDFSSETDDGSRFQLLQSKSGRFDPIILTTHHEFNEDKQFARDTLSEIFNSYDLTEPFNRIEFALEQVQAQKTNDE